MTTHSEAVILSTNWEWRHSLAHTLDANGMDYLFAGSMQDCKDIVSREAVEMIFLDTHLVDVDKTCEDLVKSVRSMDSRVKIVVVSHVDDWDWCLAAARKDAFAVIPFPCQPTDIEWVLSRASRAAIPVTRPARGRELPTHA